MGGSEGQVTEIMRFPHPTEHVRLPVEIHLTCKSRVKKWAYDNAWTLIVMAICFTITWAYLVYTGVKNSVA